MNIKNVRGEECQRSLCCTYTGNKTVLDKKARAQNVKKLSIKANSGRRRKDEEKSTFL